MKGHAARPGQLSRTATSNQLILLQCPRCGNNYLPDEFSPDEVPRCIDWCEPFDDDVPAGQAPALEGVYLEDLMARRERSQR